MNSMASSKPLTATIGRIGAKISLEEQRQSTKPRPLPNSDHSLAHQGIIVANISDDCGSDIFRLTVGLSTEHDSTLGVVQQSLDPVEVPVVWEASDDSRLGRSIGIEFFISTKRYNVNIVENGHWVCIRFFKGGYQILLTALGNEDVIRCNTRLKR